MNTAHNPNRLILCLDASDDLFKQQLQELTAFDQQIDSRIQKTVDEIIRAVRQRGDAALLEYTQRFDQHSATTIDALELSRKHCQNALNALPAKQREALENAADLVRSYHERQKSESWHYTDQNGLRLGQKVTALDRAGLYVPGGRAAYPSSVLMNAIPAKVAGVGELTMVVPTPNGEQNPLVLAAAALTGVDRVWTIGGAQAIAALAYGTESIAQVDKITGPGNAYVAEAKRRVFGTVGIDMIAGPSEVLIISDGSGDPEWIAMDLFAQAEHDELAQSILLCTEGTFLQAVYQAIERLLPTQPRANIIRRSLAQRGALILVSSLAEACQLANQIAPEHLELALPAEQATQCVEAIRHAGAIFIGHYSVEALGDYCAGPNHVLPTMRSARFSSPLGVYDFQKRSSLIEISAAAAQKLAPIAATLAEGEGLFAHARSATLRLK